MKLLDLAWDTLTEIAQRDYDTLRLILDERLPSPVLATDGRGLVIKLPVPSPVDDDKYSLQGLRMSADERSWNVIWRLFKASLYHVALHAAYSDFTRYAGWAKGKEMRAATFSVSLVEDLNMTTRASKKWPGLLTDMAYSNYIASLRARDANLIQDDCLRFATKLLLSTWGVYRKEDERNEEDEEAQTLASSLRSLAEGATKKKVEESKALLLDAAQRAYSAVIARGSLPEVPFFPHTEAHGQNSLFFGSIRKTPDSRRLLSSAYEVLGLDKAVKDDITLVDAKEAYLDITALRSRQAKILQRYEKAVSSTRLDGVGFPIEDYAMFLRIKADLAGPIRNIRDQLRLVKNVLDDTSGHESGQVDMQAAIQVLASGKMRTDVFQRDESVNKDESWAILLDASKSISSFSHEVKGIATCLSEVARELIPKQNQWAAYSFNSSLQIIKDFEEEFSLSTKARIGGIAQRSATLLPDALTTCHRILASQPVDLKIIVVVSDGFPTGYVDIEKTLVSTVKEISKAGTLLIGIGVNSSDIADYFTVNCVLDSPYNMMKSFVKAYLELSSLF